MTYHDSTKELIKFSSMYGEAVLEPIGPVRPVSKVRWDYAPYKYSLEDLEKLALITGNSHLQISFGYPPKDMGYVVIHYSVADVRYGRIHSIIWNGGDPTKELERIGRTRWTQLTEF